LTFDMWVAKHPYLQPMADLHARVRAAAEEVPAAGVGTPTWDHHLKDFHSGVPLLMSSHLAMDLASVEKAILALLEKLIAKPLPGKFVEEIPKLCAELRRDPDSPRRTVAWLLGRKSYASSNPGLLYFLGWTVLARCLCPVVAAFGGWRDEERWLRSYCPICGAPPAMAQLAGVDPGRLRLLSCGHCNTRWRYRRTGCPFCEDLDDHRLAAVAVTGENGLRIDYCEACKGYLKTYNGEGSETVMLSDWTSIHLDVIAADRGLKRLAASLYQL
jgi:FdhE protein